MNFLKKKKIRFWILSSTIVMIIYIDMMPGVRGFITEAEEILAFHSRGYDILQ